MKTFAKHFVVSFLVLTFILMPGWYLVEAVGGIRFLSNGETAMIDLDFFINPESPLFDSFNKSKRVNILILGVNEGMTDTIMLASYDYSSEDQRLDIISIPRDTYYERKVSNTASLKINSIYNTKKENGGGVEGVAKAVSKVLHDIPINYYAVVDYNAVKEVVDEIGGVEVDIPFRMKYDDPYDKPALHIDFPKGQRTLTGDEAVKYLRFRKNNDGSGYPDQDLGRIKAQQEFIKSAAKKAIGPQIISVVNVVLKNVESDITIGTAGTLATKLTKLSPDNIYGHTIPNKLATIDGLSFVKADDKGIEEMLKEIFDPQDTPEEDEDEDGDKDRAGEE